MKAANLPGGYHELDPESDVVTSKTQVALDSIAQQYGSGRTLGMAKIESASSQVTIFYEKYESNEYYLFIKKNLFVSDSCWSELQNWYESL